MPHGSFGLCRIFPILFSQNLLNLHFRISPQFVTYLRYFIIRIVFAAQSHFLNLFLYFRKHDLLRKVFTLSFLMTGIFFIPIFSQNRGLGMSGIWKLPYPQFNHFPDLTEKEILFESIFHESLSNLNYSNNHAKRNFGNYKVVCRQY